MFVAWHCTISPTALATCEEIGLRYVVVAALLLNGVSGGQPGSQASTSWMIPLRLLGDDCYRPATRACAYTFCCPSAGAGVLHALFCWRRVVVLTRGCTVAVVCHSYPVCPTILPPNKTESSRPSKGLPASVDISRRGGGASWCLPERSLLGVCVCVCLQPLHVDPYKSFTEGQMRPNSLQR